MLYPVRPHHNRYRFLERAQHSGSDGGRPPKAKFMRLNSAHRYEELAEHIITLIDNGTLANSNCLRRSCGQTWDERMQTGLRIPGAWASRAIAELDGHPKAKRR